MRVVIADDHPIVLHGLHVFLSGLEDVEAVDCVSAADALLSLLPQAAPDILVSDPAMRGLDLASLSRLLREHPGMRIVAFSSDCSRNHVRALLRTGVMGYLPKTSSLDQVAAVLRAVVRGEVTIAPSVGAALVASSAAQVLTAREAQVLRLLGQGKSSKEVAAVLRISPRTVDRHRTNIMRKLDMHSIAALVHYALYWGV